MNGKKFRDLLECTGLVNHVFGNTLDLILTREYNNDFSIKNLNVNSFISVHRSLIFQISYPKLKVQINKIKYRNFTKINIDEFKRDIRNSSLCLDFYNCNNVVDLASQYDNTMFTIVNKHAPVLEKCIRIKSNSDWFNSDLLNLKLFKRKRERLWLRSKSLLDRNLYKIARNDYVNSCSRARSEGLTKKILQCEGDDGKLFNFYSKITNIPVNKQ